MSKSRASALGVVWVAAAAVLVALTWGGRGGADRAPAASGDRRAIADAVTAASPEPLADAVPAASPEPLADAVPAASPEPLADAVPAASPEPLADAIESDAPRAYAGAAQCRACHTVETDHWSQTLHRTIFELAPRDDTEARSCETCHGPGADHIANPTGGAIRRFTRDSPEAVSALNDTCLDCHRGGTRIHWLGSTHEREDLACSDCHNPMAALSAGGLLREASVNRTCFSCHPQQRAEFHKRSHMPLHEGAIDCADCHNPHGSAADALLAEVTVNDTCTQCHAEKRGPFLFEHAPVQENCLHCHNPHGSVHDQLLVAPRPFLCQQCHSQIGFSHPNDLVTRGNRAGGTSPDLRLAGRSCTTCHAQIHGSNHPSGLRFHR